MGNMMPTAAVTAPTDAVNKPGDPQGERVEPTIVKDTINESLVIELTNKVDGVNETNDRVGVVYESFVIVIHNSFTDSS
jgi:hypothetical protein